MARRVYRRAHGTKRAVLVPERRPTGDADAADGRDDLGAPRGSSVIGDDAGE